MPGRNLLGAGGAAGTNQNNKTLKMAVAASVLAMLLLFTAAAISMPPDDRARLSAFFGSNKFLMVCVLSQINLGCLLAMEAVLAPTPAARRSYVLATVACFVELAIKLYRILVLRPAAVEDDDV